MTPTFGGRLGRLRLHFLVGICLAVGILGTAANAEAEPEKVFFITLKSSINPGTANYVERALIKAKADGAQALVIELDTPGGLLESTRSIVQVILNSDLPVAIYVAPRGGRAGSAGVFITLSGHLAAMAPGTNIGAAHPVTGLGKDPEEAGGAHLGKKIENDTAAFIETIANQRQRNVEWARDAVLKSVSVTEEKALQLRIIDFIASDRADLLRQMHDRQVTVIGGIRKLNTLNADMVNLDMTWRQSFLDLFSNPHVIYFLILIAMLGIYLELSHPGAILPGAAAALSIVLILLTSQSLPFKPAGIALLILSGVLFVLEVYITSFGMLALGGLVCFILGSLFLFDVETELGFMGIPKLTIATTTVLLAAIVGGVAYLVARSQRAQVATGSEGMIGELGEAVGDLNPEGQVLVGGEYWRARSAITLRAGQRIRVKKVQDLVLEVEAID